MLRKVVFDFEAPKGRIYIEKSKRYPSAAGATLDAPNLPLTAWTPRGQGLLLSWSGLDEYGSPTRSVDHIAPLHRFVAERWFIPGVGATPVVLTLLMTW